MLKPPTAEGHQPSSTQSVLTPFLQGENPYRLSDLLHAGHSQFLHLCALNYEQRSPHITRSDVLFHGISYLLFLLLILFFFYSSLF